MKMIIKLLHHFIMLSWFTVFPNHFEQNTKTGQCSLIVVNGAFNHFSQFLTCLALYPLDDSLP